MEQGPMPQAGHRKPNGADPERWPETARWLQRSYNTPNASNPNAGENEQRLGGPGGGGVPGGVVRHGEAQESEEGPVADTRSLTRPSPIQEHGQPRPETGVQRQGTEDLPMAVGILKHRRDLRAHREPLRRKRQSGQKIP